MRIRGVNLPKDKSLFIALTRLYGIGVSTAMSVCAKAAVDPNFKVFRLSDEQENRVLAVIAKDCVIEGDLRKKVSMDIKRLIDLGCYRGTRHRRRLPVRGQRTHTNARTVRGHGRSRVPIAGKKKAV